MAFRYWGPAQTNLVNTFRSKVSPASRPSLPSEKPYYIEANDKDGTYAILKIEDCLSDSLQRPAPNQPFIHVSELLFDPKRTTQETALLRMTNVVFNLIRDTYHSKGDFVVTFDAAYDTALQAKFIKALQAHNTCASYKFVFPRLVIAA